MNKWLIKYESLHIDFLKVFCEWGPPSDDRPHQSRDGVPGQAQHRGQWGRWHKYYSISIRPLNQEHCNISK